ncbi:hypothetical protein [[Eubacterium] hominis]|uniref:hypothetical protein n=1 Tax=[Eubacterium] hominis TaxID=2764325 RepID=UPI003A4DA818
MINTRKKTERKIILILMIFMSLLCLVGCINKVKKPVDCLNEKFTSYEILKQEENEDVLVYLIQVENEPLKMVVFEKKDKEPQISTVYDVENGYAIHSIGRADGKYVAIAIDNSDKKLDGFSFNIYKNDTDYIEVHEGDFESKDNYIICLYKFPQVYQNLLDFNFKLQDIGKEQ